MSTFNLKGIPLRYRRKFWRSTFAKALAIGAGYPTALFAPYGPATAAGTGGIPVVATSIVSGNGAGHFALASGVITITSAGQTAGLSGSPYVLVFDNGNTLTITASAAGTYDVRTQAEWDTFKVQLTAASAATWANKKVFFRPDSYRGNTSIVTGINGTADILKAGDFGGFTIEGRTAAIDATVFPPRRADDPCTIDKFYFRNTKNVTVRKLATTRVPETKVQLRGTTGDYVTNIWVDALHIGGIVADPQGDYSLSSNYPNIGNGTYYFIDTTGSNNNCVGGCKVTNNVLEWGNFGVNLCADRPGDGHMEVTGNFAHYMYADCFHISCGAGNQPHDIDFHDNIGMNPMGLGTDDAGSGPHKDFCQYQGSSTQTVDFVIRAYRNRMIAGTARGGSMQGFFFAGLTSGSAFVQADIVDFLYVGGNQNAVAIYSAKNCNLENIQCVSKATAPTVVDNITIELGTSFSSGTHTVSRCVADYFSFGSASVTQTNNVTLGHQGATIPYTTAFVGPDFTNTPATVAAAMAMFAPKPGGPLDLTGLFDVGAVGGRVNFATTIPGNDGSNIAPPVTNMKAAYTTVHNAPSTASTNYTPPCSGASTSTISSSNSQCRTLHGVAGTIKNLAVRAGNALTTGSYAVTLRVNGADTALTATVDSTNQVQFDTTHTVALLATDDIDFKIVPTGTPTAVTRMQISWEFDSDSLSVPLFSWEVATGSTANFFLPGAVGGSTSTELELTGIMPCAGTFSGIGVKQSGAPGAGTANNFTLRKNGADSALTNSVSGTNTSVAVGGTPVHVVAGDMVSIGRTLTGAPANASLGIVLVWTPDNAGDRPVFGNITGANYTTGPRFGPASGYNATTETTESNTNALAPVAMTLSSLRFGTSAAPGAGQSRTATLRKNGAASALSVALSAAANDVDTDSVTLAAGDLIDVQYDVSSSSAAATTYSRTGMISRVA